MPVLIKLVSQWGETDDKHTQCLRCLQAVDPKFTGGGVGGQSRLRPQHRGPQRHSLWVFKSKSVTQESPSTIEV